MKDERKTKKQLIAELQDARAWETICADSGPRRRTKGRCA